MTERYAKISLEDIVSVGTKSHDLVVLLVLALNVRDVAGKRICSITIAEIAGKLKVGTSTVETSLRRLREGGRILRSTRSGLSAAQRELAPIVETYAYVPESAAKALLRPQIREAPARSTLLDSPPRIERRWDHVGVAARVLMGPPTAQEWTRVQRLGMTSKAFQNGLVELKDRFESFDYQYAKGRITQVKGKTLLLESPSIPERDCDSPGNESTNRVRFTGERKCDSPGNDNHDRDEIHQGTRLRSTRERKCDSPGISMRGNELIVSRTVVQRVGPGVADLETGRCSRCDGTTVERACVHGSQCESRIR
jgi:hypothetical protein